MADPSATLLAKCASSVAQDDSSEVAKAKVRFFAMRRMTRRKEIAEVQAAVSRGTFFLRRASYLRGGSR